MGVLLRPTQRSRGTQWRSPGKRAGRGAAAVLSPLCGQNRAHPRWAGPKPTLRVIRDVSGSSRCTSVLSRGSPHAVGPVRSRRSPPLPPKFVFSQGCAAPPVPLLVDVAPGCSLLRHRPAAASPFWGAPLLPPRSALLSDTAGPARGHRSRMARCFGAESWFYATLAGWRGRWGLARHPEPVPARFGWLRALRLAGVTAAPPR